MSGEPKHTPGPWWAGERAPKHLGSVILISSSAPRVATGVAHAWTEADAALISAAPRMLQLLYRIQAATGGVSEEEWKELKATIAQAEGRDA